MGTPDVRQLAATVRQVPTVTPTRAAGQLTSPDRGSAEQWLYERMSERLAYFSGDWIPESQLAIPVGDLGFAMGVTVTERLRTFGGRVFRQREHLERMRRSLAAIGLSANAITTELDNAIKEYCERHRDQVLPNDDWTIAAFVTPGAGAGPTVCVHGFPLAFDQWVHEYTAGSIGYLSEHRQVPPNCWPADLKCRSRMHYYLADSEARIKHPQARAVLLDQEGFIGEGSISNVVIFQQATGLATPRSTKVLPGVSVGVIAELASQLGVAFTERDITPQEFTNAEEIWFTSTSVCMLPLVTMNDVTIGRGKPGATYARFLEAWNALVGVDIMEQAKQFANRNDEQ